MVGGGRRAWALTYPDALAQPRRGLSDLLTSGKLTPPQPQIFPLGKPPRPSPPRGRKVRVRYGLKDCLLR